MLGSTQQEVSTTTIASEKEIQSAVLDWLNTIPHCRAWRQNVGGMEYRKADGRKGIVRFGQPGMADLSGIVHGVRLEVEIKRPGKVPTPEQEEWLAFIIRLEGVAFWVTGLDACAAKLRWEFHNRGWIWKREWEVK
jgi:hypothetical protein